MSEPVVGPSPIEGDGEPRGLRARGFVISAVLLGLAVVCFWRAHDIRRPGEPLDEGLVSLGITFLWVLVGLLSSNVRAYRQRRLIREAEASGGTLTEPPSPLLWPATMLGILWRTFLLLVPGATLWWYVGGGSTGAAATCERGGTCLQGSWLWTTVAVVLLVGGLAIAVLSARKAIGNARRRRDGLPPEILLEPPTAAAASHTKVDRSAVAPVAPPSSPAATAIDQRLDRLAELGRLHEQGVIDDAELERLKAEVLGEQA
ncbi:hypothetical protein B7486_54655 [cyanobacterium TDX16]|nr:hypothetical protein B7486_54655 [cyanobacterium TDX16]